MRTPILSLITVVSIALALAFAPVQASSASSGLVSIGPDRGWIDALALSPQFAADGRLWTAPFGGHIFASVTHGAAWYESHGGETDPIVTGLAASPGFSTDSTVFASADDGVFRSQDGGTSWVNTSAGLSGHNCRNIVPSPAFATDASVFVSTDSGVYRSTDRGGSWQAPVGFTGALFSLAVASSSSGTLTLFAGESAGGMVMSLDSGRSWAPVSGFPTARSVLAIAPSPLYTTDSTVFVGTDDGVWVSHDAGSSWQQSGLGGDRVPALVLSPRFDKDHTAFAGSASGSGLWITQDAGATWNPTRSGSSYYEALAISPQYATDHTIVAGSAGEGIFLSSDGGATWHDANSGLHAAEIAQLGVSNGTIGVAGNGGASALSPGNADWSPYQAPAPFFTAYGISGSDVFLSVQSSGLRVSHDAGASWSQTELPVSQVSSVGLSPSYPSDHTVLVADGYVYRSTDQGMSWSQSSGIAGNDVHRFGFSPTFASDGVVFAATVYHRVLRSSDGGRTWSDASTGLPSDQISQVLLSPNFDTDATAYAATGGDGVYVTRDRGQSWFPMQAQPPVKLIVALQFDTDGAMLAGTDRGIFRFDNGSWTSITPGWDAYVTDLQFNGSDLVIGTLGDGVWVLPRTAALQPSITPTRTTTAAPPPPPPGTIPPTRTPTPIPTATPAPTAHPTPRPLHPHISVVPRPLSAGAPALVLIRGPGRGSIALRLSAHGWSRSFHGTLSASGGIAFGFVAPRSNVALVAQIRGKTRSATVKMTIAVTVPPPPPPPRYAH